MVYLNVGNLAWTTGGEESIRVKAPMTTALRSTLRRSIRVKVFTGIHIYLRRPRRAVKMDDEKLIRVKAALLAFLSFNKDQFEKNWEL